MPARTRGRERRGPHWESWALRGLLVLTAAGHLLGSFGPGVWLALVGLLLTMIPPAIGRWSGRHVPWMLELPFVLGITIQFVLESFNVFEWFALWDKLAHFAEILLATIVAAFLVLGYRELRGLEIPDGLAVAGLVCFGISWAPSGRSSSSASTSSWPRPSRRRTGARSSTCSPTASAR